MTQELKPCPFCGENNLGVNEYEPTFNGQRYQPNQFGVFCDCEAKSHPHESKEKAIEAWNNRPIEDLLTAENKALKENQEASIMIGHDLAKEEYKEYIRGLEEQNKALRDALYDIVNYTGGCDWPTEDPYVMERAEEALNQTEGA